MPAFGGEFLHFEKVTDNYGFVILGYFEGRCDSLRPKIEQCRSGIGLALLGLDVHRALHLKRRFSRMIGAY